MIKKIALSLMAAGTLLSAQTITQIKYEGLGQLSADAAAEISGIHTGDQMDVSKINQSIKNFYAQGYFKDVWVESKGSVLIYHFEEKLAIANVEIKGYGSGDEGEKLLASSGLKKGDLYDARDVRKAKEAIIANLESQGYYDTVVEVTTSKVTDSSISVVFEVNKGEKITINEMNFVGAKEVDKDDLQSQLANKERSWLGWIPFLNDGIAKVDQLEYDAYRVKDTYMQNGYLDAYVSRPLMRVDFGSYNAKVDYQVEEGVQYNVGKVAISQNLGLNNEELMDELSLKTGKTFNIKRMRSDMEKLKELAGNQGYAYADVNPQMHKDPKTKIIDLNYVIVQGVPVTINDVLISGNDTTKDRVIRRYIYLAPGDKFNATDLKDSKNALGRTGFFEKVDIETQRVSEDKIDLLVKVKEAPTGTISVGGGYGSYEGLMFNASVADKNLLGSGINGSVGLDISKISTNYNLSLVNPRIWDSEYSLGLDLYKRNYEYIDFTQDQLGGSLMVGKQFFRHFQAAIGVGYVDNQSEYADNNLSYYNPTSSTYTYIIDPFFKDLYNDKYTKTSLLFNLTFDNTDDYYVPREGMIASLNFEYASLSGGDYNATKYPNGYGSFVKGSGKFGVFYGMEDLIDYDLILRFKGRISTIEGSSDGEKIPTAEKLFLGGIGSVRGYDPYSISPMEDIYDENGTLVSSVRVGGTRSASATIEASIPLSEAANMRLAFFYDIGYIEGKLWDGTSQNYTRSSVGAMIEWNSMFGPINLVFAKALDAESYDRTSSFEFSMGTKF